METKTYEIPKEKFNFARKADISHDTKLETKPVGYLHDAFRRFCKNKGAVVAAVIIALLILFALIVPFCTPYTVKYNDSSYQSTLPKLKLFENTNFWDGCEDNLLDRYSYIYLYAMGQETGHNAIKNQKAELTGEGLYKCRVDSYHKHGTVYKNLEMPEYAALQAYQDEYKVQVIYPIVRKRDRPEAPQDTDDANYYFKTQKQGSKTVPVLDEDGNIILNYWTYTDADKELGFTDDYTSVMRIEGDGEDGVWYAYSSPTSSGVQVRVNYYEYYIYEHKMIYKDGIEEPYFILGTTGEGKDILTCLASGARFSFIFAIAVAAVNMFVGAIYGAVAGYYGGKIDLVMERISDILSAVPFMIVITLLKLHMGGSSQILVLFIAFFLTGWIGMAGTTRMQFYRYKNQEYVLAARTLGARDRRLMWKHIFPNALGTLVTSCALVIPSMIYSETNLSYLGIINLSSGSITSVGTLIANGQSVLSTAPHVALFPSIFLALLMLTFNLFGNGLRDAFNPSLRGSEG